jgi:predicted O-linked N-acetylglucosamine transferase (SPINDLY family)
MTAFPNIFDDPHAPYYIFIWTYNENSGGIRAMHYMCHALNLMGEEAYIFTDKTSPLLRTPALTPDIIARHNARKIKPVVVYPETVHGNPYGAENVARYLLNVPGLLTQNPKLDWGQDDLIYTSGDVLVPQGMRAELLEVPLINARIYNRQGVDDRQRKGTLLWLSRHLDRGGKLLPITAQSTEISFRVPRRTPEELAALYRSAELLYAYEPSTACYEAQLCGCPVVYLPNEVSLPPEFKDKIFLSSCGAAWGDAPEQIAQAKRAVKRATKYYETCQKNFWRQLESFVQETQLHARRNALKPRSAKQILEKGMTAFQAEDFATAIASFSELLDKAPENPLPPAYLAFIAARQGEVSAAAEFIAVAMRVAPERADLKAALGESFLKTGNADLAANYLGEAVAAQPDLWDAYPAYAQSLHLAGQSEAAVALLRPVAEISSSAQANVQNVLLEILSQQGDLGEFARVQSRFSRGLADDLLAVRALAHFEDDGAHLLETLGRIQQQLADACSDKADSPIGKTRTPREPLKIAFLVGDFAREAGLRRLPALLRYLPPEDFTTFLLINDPQYTHNDCANVCAVLANQSFPVYEMDDALALDALQKIMPDILIDLDAYDPMERLAVFLKADAPYKFLWGEAPMPPLSPKCRVLTGARLAESSVLPCVTLPETGEYYDLPELPDLPSAVPVAGETIILGVLTPAKHIDRKGWRLFAEILKTRPGSRLLINLEDLGEAAQAFIGGIFASMDVAIERLRFIHARAEEELCRFWQITDLGLAPPTDAGGLALPTCLWMGRPYLALASPLPWSRRPAALLELAGAEEWICQTLEAYIERACSVPPAPDPRFRARMRAAGLNDPQIFAQGFADSMKTLFAQ